MIESRREKEERGRGRPGENCWTEKGGGMQASEESVKANEESVEVREAEEA